MKTTYSKSIRDGQQATTFHGLWYISTSKTFSGKIVCSALLCDETEEIRGVMHVKRFSTASTRHTLAMSTGRATLKEITAVHEKGLEAFRELYPEPSDRPALTLVPDITPALEVEVLPPLAKAPETAPQETRQLADAFADF